MDSQAASTGTFYSPWNENQFTSPKFIGAPMFHSFAADYNTNYWKSHGMPSGMAKRYRIMTQEASRMSRVAGFKDASTNSIVNNLNLIFHSGGCDCLPLSRSLFYDSLYNEEELRDILDIKGNHRSWLGKRFPTAVYAWNKRTDYKYIDVSKDVLDSERVRNACAMAAPQVEVLGNPVNAKDALKGDKKQRSRASSIMQKMKAQTSNWLIKLTGWFLHHFLGRLLSSIVVHNGHMKMLLKALKSGKPVIYLPSHRSHMDYILLTFVLFNYDLPAPYVAAGDNLQIPVFGWLLRHLGGFFIRRKLDNGNAKDRVYRAILHTYMQEILRTKQQVEFYIEGGRSRTGKSLYPKAGLLSVVVDSVIEGVVSDAVIVPISISYERLVEGDFCMELLGHKKERETFWKTMKSIWLVWTGKYGNVRLNFCQPFSVKEFLEKSAIFPKNHNINYEPHKPDAWDENEAEKPVKFMRHCSTDVFVASDTVGDDLRWKNQMLAEHVAYTCAHNQTIMSTQILAFLLLYHTRLGCTVKRMQEAFVGASDILTNLEKVLGFSGETIDAIFHALEILRGESLVKLIRNAEEVQDFDDIQLTDVIIPQLQHPRVLVLAYYANAVTPAVALPGVLANSLTSLMDPKDVNSNGEQASLEVDSELLVERAVQLGQLLKYEFIMNPPCRSLEGLVREQIENFLEADIIAYTEASGESTLNRQYKNLALQLRLDTLDEIDESYVEDDDSYEEPITYVFSMKAVKDVDKFWFYKNALGPIIECYYITSIHLLELLVADKEEQEFIDTVLGSLKERVVKNMACYNESASLDTLKNALRSFENLEIVNSYDTALGKKMIGLSKRFNTSESVNAFILDLESFRYC